MRLVTFATDMAPHGAGDTRLVSDEIAVALERAAAISASDPWPAVSPPVAQKPVRPLLKPSRPAGGHDQRKAR